MKSMKNIRFSDNHSYDRIPASNLQAGESNMIWVSEIQTAAPQRFQTPLQQKVYETLGELRIPYERVDTDEVITMEDCAAIDEKLDMKMVKTLFLCNRQKTEFYLFITCGDKPFHAKEFSAALGVARLSFAPVEQMESMLGTKVGAATVFSALLDTARGVQIVVDEAVLRESFYGCSDGTTTGYLKIATEDIFDKFLPAIGRRARTVRV